MTTETLTIGAAPGAEHDHTETAANKEFGFWLYLMSDLILFSAIFATFGVLGRNYAGGPSGRELFHLPYVLGETMLLLFSSAACGLAVLAGHEDRRTAALVWLAVTALLGLGFLSMEIHEFRRMILEGNGPERSGFLSSFFTLVGTHGAHVASGLIWLGVMMVQITFKGMTGPVQSRLMRLGMFWHFLDIVWIGIFTFVYMLGVM
jgi:cytochrome o ubiquinol oxidase subunit 3